MNKSDEQLFNAILDIGGISIWDLGISSYPVGSGTCYTFRYKGNEIDVPLNEKRPAEVAILHFMDDDMRMIIKKHLTRNL